MNKSDRLRLVFDKLSLLDPYGKSATPQFLLDEHRMAIVAAGTHEAQDYLLAVFLRTQVAFTDAVVIARIRQAYLSIFDLVCDFFVGVPDFI